MGYLYLIRFGRRECYKIGVSRNDPRKRLAQLQTGSPERLYLIKSYRHRNYKEWEQQLHKQLAEYRTSGEWFDCSLDTIEETISNVIGGNMRTIGRIAGIMWTMVLIVTISIIVLTAIWPETMLPFFMGIY